MTRIQILLLSGWLMASVAAWPALAQIPETLKEPSFMSYAFDANAKALKAEMEKGDLRTFLMVYNNHAAELAKKAPRLDFWYYKASMAFNDDFQKQVDPVLTALNNQLSGSDFPIIQWRQAASAYRDLDEKINDYQSFELLKDSRFRSPKAEGWEKALARAKDFFRDRRDKAFKDYLVSNTTENFFAMYPLAAGENERVFVEAHLSEVLEHAKATPDLGMDHVFLWLSNRVAQESLVEYVETALHLGNQGQKWADFTKQFRAIKTLGSSDPFLRALFDRHVAVFALSARDRLANWDKHLKFPDLSVREVRPEGIEELLSKPEGAKDFVVLIAGASSSSDRHVISQTDLDSKFVSGHHFEPNPDYDIAVANVNIARDNFRQAQDQYNQQMSQNNNSGGNGLSALGAGLNGFAAGLALGNARNRLQDAYNNLQRTPRQLQMLDFSEYSYSTSEIRASKDIVYMVYIINRSQSEMIKVSRKNNLPADFSLVYNLNKKDQSFDRIRAAHKEESDIDAFEKEPYPVLMASLLEVADGLESIERPKLVMELQSVAEGVPSSKLKVNTSKIAAMVQDERFESVVVVQNPRGGLGAGFYVAPNLIITNQHVVAGSSFPEIKLRSGVTCVGKVVKTDIGLDLALIKVSKSGKPLELLEDNFEVGTSVDAIGHPAGLTYTLTRGVISAVRYIQNPLVPGSSKMLVIQTDAAINPGNSGGPLMRGEKVIGINSQKLSAKGIEGLGFALHATEIKQFLGETN